MLNTALNSSSLWVLLFILKSQLFVPTKCFKFLGFVLNLKKYDNFIISRRKEKDENDMFRNFNLKN